MDFEYFPRHSSKIAKNLLGGGVWRPEIDEIGK
jgi:hypothetical protein